MSAQPQQGMSLDEFMLSLRNRMDSTGCDNVSAVDALFNPTLIDGTALFKLARYGAIRMLGDAQHSLRQQLTGRSGEQGGPRSTVGAPGISQAAKVRSVLGTLEYQGADGQNRLLLDFSVDDWRALRMVFRTTARGWQSKARLAENAVHLMVEHDAKRMRDLPLDVLRPFEDKVRKAW